MFYSRSGENQLTFGFKTRTKISIPYIHINLAIFGYTLNTMSCGEYIIP